MRSANVNTNFRGWRVQLLLAIIILPVAVVGCSSGADKPFETGAREFYESNLKELISTGILKVETFKKTNARTLGEDGVQIYEFEYQADLFFPKGWMPECVYTTHFDINCHMAITRGVRPKEVGAKELDTGKIKFEKTENDWRARN